MRWLTRFLCSHETVMRERRPLVAGDETVSDIPHFVCVRCGRATPIVRRTLEEHRRAKATGTPAPMAARVVPRPPRPMAVALDRRGVPPIQGHRAVI